MKTPPNKTASESAPSKADFTLFPGVDATETHASGHEVDQAALDSSATGSIAIKPPTSTQKAVPSALADLQALRLPANYGATLGVKKLLTTVSVGRPKKHQFFRAHPDDNMTFAAMFLEQKETRESFVVQPDVAQQISELVRPVMLHAAIDRQNNVFLIPVPLPGEAGTRNPWHESLAQAVERSKPKWLRITANMHTGGYDVYEADGVLPEPEWPAHGMEALIEVAFRGKIIKSLDHPVVQSLLGRV